MNEAHWEELASQTEEGCVCTCKDSFYTKKQQLVVRQPPERLSELAVAVL